MLKHKLDTELADEIKGLAQLTEMVSTAANEIAGIIAKSESAAARDYRETAASLTKYADEVHARAVECLELAYTIYSYDEASIYIDEPEMQQ